MTPGDIGSGVIWALLILGAVIGTIGSSRGDARAKQKQIEEDATRKLKTQIAEREELAFIADAAALLPNGEAALAKLKSRYTWAEITETTRLSRKVRRAHRELSCSESITLPNMKRVPLGKEELAAVRAARKEVTPMDHLLGPTVEELYNGFTVQTLSEIEWHGFVSVEPGIDDTNRTYKMSLTPLGKRFLKMERLFMDTNDGLGRPICGPESPAEKDAVAKVFRAAVYG